MRKLGFVVPVLMLFLAAYNSVSAQCAMCGATTSTATNEGSSAAAGLNFGILYMLVLPYLAVMAIAYLWYKKYRKRDNVVLHMHDNKINLN